MSRDLAILCPVLGRPHRVAPLLDSIERATPGARVLFLADPDDHAELEAIECESIRGDLCVKVDDHGGKYSEKINRGLWLTSESYIFTGADDLVPEPGWFTAAVACLRDGVQVVGVNDLIERRPARQEHATHFLVARDYVESGTIDGPGLFHEGYDHSWCDNEFIATAKARGVYAYCADSHVRHEHPLNDTAPDDETYRKGREKFHEDRQIFEGRRALWA